MHVFSPPLPLHIMITFVLMQCWDIFGFTIMQCNLVLDSSLFTVCFLRCEGVIPSLLKLDTLQMDN